MDFLKKLFKSSKIITEPTVDREPANRIRLTSKNINQYPKFYKLLNEGKIKFDKKERLRYLHGAPVGDLLLTKKGKDGTPIYQESAEEWFDPESSRASEFEWPS